MRHISSKCGEAQCLSECKILYEAVQGTSNQITGDYNTINNAHNSHNTNIINIVPVGSADEKAAFLKLFQDKDVVKAITSCPLEDIPALLLRYLKGPDAPPEQQNVSVDGSIVVENRGTRDARVRRASFVKKTMGDMLDTCAAVDPQLTADEGAMHELLDELQAKRFKSGLTDASCVEVARMAACSDPASYRLGHEAKHFIHKTRGNIDAELAAFPVAKSKG
jgi:hypothetical protein